MPDTEPTDRDRHCARRALALGLIRDYLGGLGLVAPVLCDLAGDDLNEAGRVWAAVRERFCPVSEAARRLVRHHRLAA